MSKQSPRHDNLELSEPFEKIVISEKESPSKEEEELVVPFLENIADSTPEKIHDRYSRLLRETNTETTPDEVRAGFYMPMILAYLTTSKLKELHKIWKTRKKTIIELREEILKNHSIKESTSQSDIYKALMEHFKKNLNSHDITQKTTILYKLEQSLKHHDKALELLSDHGINPYVLSVASPTIILTPLISTCIIIFSVVTFIISLIGVIETPLEEFKFNIFITSCVFSFLANSTMPLFILVCYCGCFRHLGALFTTEPQLTENYSTYETLYEKTTNPNFSDEELEEITDPNEKDIIALMFMEKATQFSLDNDEIKSKENLEKAWELSEEATTNYAINLFNTYDKQGFAKKIDELPYTYKLIQTIAQNPGCSQKLFICLTETPIKNYSDTKDLSQQNNGIFAPHPGERLAFLTGLALIQPEILKKLFPIDSEKEEEEEKLILEATNTDFIPYFKQLIKGDSKNTSLNIEELAKHDNHERFKKSVLDYIKKFHSNSGDMNGEFNLYPNNSKKIINKISRYFSDIRTHGDPINSNKLLAMSQLLKANLFFDRTADSEDSRLLLHCLDAIIMNLTQPIPHPELGPVLIECWGTLFSRIADGTEDKKIKVQLDPEHKSLYKNWLKAIIKLKTENPEHQKSLATCLTTIHDPTKNQDNPDTDIIKNRLKSILNGKIIEHENENNNFYKDLLETMEENNGFALSNKTISEISL